MPANPQMVAFLTPTVLDNIAYFYSFFMKLLCRSVGNCPYTFTPEGRSHESDLHIVCLLGDNSSRS